MEFAISIVEHAAAILVLQWSLGQGAILRGTNLTDELHLSSFPEY